MNKSILIIIPILFLLFSCNNNVKTERAKTPEYKIKIIRDSTLHRASYSIIDSIESVILQAYQRDINKGIIIYRYKGKTQLADLLPKIDTLLYSVFNDSMNNFNFSTIAWGRLSTGLNRDYTLAKRLVLFAKNSDQWDSQKGIPLSTHINDFVKTLKDEFSIELDPLLQKYNYKIESISAEKILVDRAEKLIFWDDIKSHVDSGDRLPYDCQLWFVISKTQ